MKSIYIHIPFCDNICSYCDFCKIYYNKKYINKYLDALKKEITTRYKQEIISTIYIGGGTPSSLDIDELEKLFAIIKIFKLSNKVEFTFECNVDSITKEKLELLINNKVNRLSIGVQSFDKNILKILNRKHTKEEVFTKIKLAKEIGFDNISIDLMYGITNDIDIVKKDLDYFFELDINHLSYYSLIVEEHTMLQINNYHNIDEDIEYQMYKYINKRLKENKYYQYETSNYTRNNYCSLHNLNYWNNGEYYGFGLGAVSYINNIRRSNTKNITKYTEGNYLDKEIFEKENIRQENDLILGLRKIEGVDINLFYQKYHKHIQEVFDIEKLLKEKKLIINNNYLKINDKYLYLANEILINFIKEEE